MLPFLSVTRAANARLGFRDILTRIAPFSKNESFSLENWYTVTLENENPGSIPGTVNLKCALMRGVMKILFHFYR